MAKRKKTREQKKVADLRRQVQHLTVNASSSIEPRTEPKTQRPVSTISLNIPAFVPKQNLNNSVSNAVYPYLIHDLKKTGLLTLSIIASQLVLYFILKNHIFVLPGLSY